MTNFGNIGVKYMSDLVIYGNDFNFMPLPKLTEFEIDIFMQIISELNEDRELELSFMDLAYEIYTKKHQSAKETLENFYKLADKLLGFKVKYSVKNRHYAFICFEKLELILDEEPNPIIKIKAQEDFYELITNLQMGFTKFELKEFMSLSGKYTKTLYRLLKQFRNTGLLKIDWSEFCKIMNIPQSYKQADIDKRIINPAIKELSSEPNLFTNEKQTIFKNLTYKKIKDPKGRGRGGKVIGIEFYFTPEPKRNEFKEMIQNLARTEKEMEKNSKPQEPKYHFLTGEEITDLDGYKDRHFYIKNKEYGGFDTCKINNLKYIEHEGKKQIWALMRNQENSKDFEMFFDSIAHMKNALNLN